MASAWRELRGTSCGEDLTVEILIPQLQLANPERRKHPLNQIVPTWNGDNRKRAPNTSLVDIIYSGIVFSIGLCVCLRAHTCSQEQEHALRSSCPSGSPFSTPHLWVRSDFHPWLLWSFCLLSDHHLCSFSHPHTSVPLKSLLAGSYFHLPEGTHYLDANRGPLQNKQVTFHLVLLRWPLAE